MVWPSHEVWGWGKVLGKTEKTSRGQITEGPNAILRQLEPY